HEAVAACWRAGGGVGTGETPMFHEGGVVARLAESCGEGGDSAACFEKPVCWDVLGPNGEKLAGAAQRRSRAGFLHQGSVMTRAEILARLPDFLADHWQDWEPEGGAGDFSRA
ncbi:MAG: hypothetical protein ACQKBY_09245, partial [Verrucomicrobiales bacterium]